jgi:hypothetical protein
VKKWLRLAWCSWCCRVAVSVVLVFFCFFSVLLAIGVGSSLSMMNDEVLFVRLDE